MGGLREVDDWLSHMAEVQRLCVAERFDGGEAALSGFIGLPGAKKEVEREKGWIQLHWWRSTNMFHHDISLN